jgi:thiol:disulfide interchange protein DsbC
MDIPSASCENPVDAQYELGKTIGVSGTPAIVLPSGEILPGYMPAERLIAYLQQKSAPPVFPGLQIKP